MKYIYILSLLFLICLQSLFLFAFNESRIENSNVSSSSFSDYPKLLPIKQYDIVENHINPEHFYIGFGDILNFNIISSTKLLSYDLIINASGSIVVPIIGEIYIGHKTLAEATKLIINEINLKYEHANISITLKKAGLFKVKVNGPFNHSVIYSVNAFNTVYDLYQIFSKEIKKDTPNPSNVSNRNIVLRRDGELYNIDLLKFAQNGNNKLNPNLQREDVITINYVDGKSSILGAVNRPGAYEFVPGETVSELIHLAGGFTYGSDRSAIEVTSFINGQLVTRHFPQEKLNEISISPSDVVMVHKDNTRNRQSIVNIDGEVKFPGPYQVNYGQTDIKTLISQAGGFTQFADTTRILLINKQIPKFQHSSFEKPIEFTTASDLSWAMQVLESSSQKYAIQLKENQFGDYKLNIGDEITVLPLLNYVDVVGAVNFPGRFTFESKKKIGFYLELSGGKHKFSQHKIYLIKSGTQRRILVKKNTIVERGDLIFIPETMEYNTWERFKDWMTVTSQLGTIILIIQNIIN